MSKITQLRQLLNRPSLSVLPSIYDCIGAKIAEKVGFEAIFTSGFGISAFSVNQLE